MTVYRAMVVLAGVVACSTSLGFAQQTAAESGSKATAVELIRDAQRAVGQVVKAARIDRTLNPDASSDAKPFWNAMKELNEALDKADTGLTLKDETFFTALATAGAAVQQAEIALDMNEGVAASVREPLNVLSGVVRALNDNYSKEASRLSQGGELTASERAQLAKLKAQQDELDKKLAEVEKKAGKNSEKIKKGAEKIRESSRRIRDANADAGGFVAAMFAARFMSELIWGWHWWWGPWGYWGPGFIDVNIIVWDTWVVDCPYDWGLVDDAILVDDLGLDAIDLDEADMMSTDDWLQEQDFSVDDADMMELTDGLDAGWDEVDTDLGTEVMGGFENNFQQMPFESGFEMNTFDDVGGFDDFGGAFEEF